jgi:hypothetical protein
MRGAPLPPSPSAPPPPPPRKPIVMFDYGQCCYHEKNKSCPVPWAWTDNKDEADLKIYNTLDGRSEFKRSRPEQKLVMLSMESEKYYPLVVNAKQQGYDISMDYRIHSGADVPIVYLGQQDWAEMLASDNDPRKKDQAMLASAVISNCSPRNNRQDVLEKLIGLMSVASFGQCHHNADLPSDLPRRGNKYGEKLDAMSRCR